jgi:hypothetical protein
MKNKNSIFSPIDLRFHHLHADPKRIIFHDTSRLIGIDHIATTFG